MINDYTKQAAVWDWDGYDETAEYEHWLDYAGRYGKKVLVPMCAHGQTGAYLAERGFRVTAFDLTPEMIAEGKKRYGQIPGLELLTADICTLDLRAKDFDFAFIAGNGDLHLLQNAHDVGRAFLSLSRHIRAGGCLALELSLPAEKSFSYPKKVFRPRVPRYTDKKVWKENEGEYNAVEKRRHINQTVYIKDSNGVDSFTQSVCLQYYERSVIVDLLCKSGFTVRNEYRNREKEPWTHADNEWHVEAIKT